jgi:glycine betaine/proline transport system permease protein
MGELGNADPSLRWYHSGPVGLVLRLLGQRPASVKAEA